MSCIRLSVVTVALDYITHVVCCIREANRDTAGEDHNLQISRRVPWGFDADVDVTPRYFTRTHRGSDSINELSRYQRNSSFARSLVMYTP